MHIWLFIVMSINRASCAVGTFNSDEEARRIALKRKFKGQVWAWYDCGLVKRLHCCEWCVVLFHLFSLLICETTYFNLL